MLKFIEKNFRTPFRIFQKLLKIIQSITDKIELLILDNRKKSEFKKLVSNLINKEYKFQEKIYVIGDSHTNFWSGSDKTVFLAFENDIETGQDFLPAFKTFHLGPALAYSLNKHDSASLGLKKTEYLIKSGIIPPNATVMLCFGEIDCRVHVLKQAEIQNKSIENIIDEIIQNYFEYIKYLQNSNINVVCWAVIASQNDSRVVHIEFPRYGSETERNIATEIFNRKLEEKCKDNNVIFCSIFNSLIDNCYKTKQEYYIDGCHLSQSAMKLAIKELISKEVLK